MMSIWMMRLAVSKTLFNFFGYLSPALNSTKSIISRDEEGIREYLTYWCVFGLLLYVEFILNFFSALRNWPPESKVLFVLWLTLPQFQGAFRIYSFVLRPYFEKYEDQIDKQISNISRGVSEKAHRHIQTILWQLFLAPNDGLLAGALSLSSSFSSTNLISSFLTKSGVDQSSEILKALTGNLGAEQLDEQTPQRVTSFSLRKQLLQNFSEMLVEGIYADVRHNYRSPQLLPSNAAQSAYSMHSQHSSHSAIVESEMQVNKVVLLKGGYYLQLNKEALDTSFGEDDREESNLHDGNIEMQSAAAASASAVSDIISVPLFLVASVTSDNFDPNLIIMSISSSFSITPTSSITPMSSATTITTPLSDSSSPKGTKENRVVYMRAENEEEGEALLAGMIVLCADTKKRVAKMISRTIYLLRKKDTDSLSAAFKAWGRFAKL